MRPLTKGKSMRLPLKFYPVLLTFLLAPGSAFVPPRAWAQDEDPRFRAVEAKGMVTAYHDENDETSRLYQSQTIDRRG